MLVAPFDELVETQQTVWQQSVDELDASVWLEADGINDVASLERYGLPSVVELAERLTAAVPAYVPLENAEGPRPAIPSLRLACRGLLFAVPGLFYLVIAFARPSRSASYTMVLAILAGWGLSQSVALVAYRVLGRAGLPSAALALKRIVAGAVVAAALALGVAAGLHELWLVGLAAGQILYVVAATVLLFHAADRLLALVLLPGALVSAGYVLHLQVPKVIAISAVAATVLAACVAAWLRADHALAQQKPSGRPLLTDLWASGPFVLQGLLSGAVVAFIPVQMLVTRPGPDVHPLDLSIVPLVLSMGFAEIELLRLRAAGGVLMHHTTRLADYERGISRLVIFSQLRFLMVLATVSVIVTVLISLTSGFNTRDLTLLCAYSILGTALLAALILVAVDRVKIALQGFWLTGCVVVCGLVVVWTSGLGIHIEAGYLAGCLVLLCSLSILAVRTLRDPQVLA